MSIKFRVFVCKKKVEVFHQGPPDTNYYLGVVKEEEEEEGVCVWLSSGDLFIFQ